MSGVHFEVDIDRVMSELDALVTTNAAALFGW